MTHVIFLSYSSAQSDIAARIELSLKGDGYSVFRDRSALPAGESFDARIRAAVEESDLFIFLITPEAVSGGRYTLTELKFAEQKWGHPRGYVLPVMVERTPIQAVPAFLRAVTILEPKGDVVAEVSAEVARMTAPWWRWFLRPRGLALVVLVALLLSGGAWKGLSWLAETRERAQQAGAFLNQAQLHLESRDYASAWTLLERAYAIDPSRTDVIDAQERLAMTWLDNRYPTSLGDNPKIVAEKVMPVLSRGAAAGKSRRSADLIAHMGWATYFRSSAATDGPDPVEHYRRGVEMDPDNTYAHAMWAYHILARRGSLADAREHFRIALQSATNRDYVRRMQIASLQLPRNPEAQEESIRVANDIRNRGEKMPAGGPNWSPTWDLWQIYYDRLLNDFKKPEFLAALPATDHVATFRWLYPEDQFPKPKYLYFYIVAQLQEHAGERAAALIAYRRVESELNSKGYGSKALDNAKAAVKRLTGPL